MTTSHNHTIMRFMYFDFAQAPVECIDFSTNCDDHHDMPTTEFIMSL